MSQGEKVAVRIIGHVVKDGQKLPIYERVGPVLRNWEWPIEPERKKP